MSLIRFFKPTFFRGCPHNCYPHETPYNVREVTKHFTRGDNLLGFAFGTYESWTEKFIVGNQICQQCSYPLEFEKKKTRGKILFGNRTVETF